MPLGCPFPLPPHPKNSLKTGPPSHYPSVSDDKNKESAPGFCSKLLNLRCGLFRLGGLSRCDRLAADRRTL